MIPPIASRFVAGETAAEAIAQVRALDDRGVGAIVNHLGEHYDDRASVEADAEAYERLIDDLADERRASLSLKPSQLGLGIDRSVFDETVDRVVAHAADAGVFCWLDMEDHETTDATLDAYERLATDHDGGVGVCVQANLRRTRDDLERLAPLPGKVRLVKGAYDEPPDLAFQGSEAVDRSFRDCLAYAFEHFDDGVAVGSHDPEMIEAAVDLYETHGTPFEFQMLMGVREDAQFELAAEYDVWQYVPYGDRWLAYFSRRVAERRENLVFALRAVLGR